MYHQRPHKYEHLAITCLFSYNMFFGPEYVLLTKLDTIYIYIYNKYLEQEFDCEKQSLSS